MKKSIKARDCYGSILERVKQNNIAKVQEENADPPPPGGNIFYKPGIGIKILLSYINFLY